MFLGHIKNKKLYFLKKMNIQHIIICYHNRLGKVEKKITKLIKKKCVVHILELQTEEFTLTLNKLCSVAET